MAKEIGPAYCTTGLTVRAMLFNQAGQVRDVVANTWDNWADADIDDYDIVMTELGTSGIYYANAPTGVDVEAEEFDFLAYTGAVSLANIRLAFGSAKAGATNANLTNILADDGAVLNLATFANQHNSGTITANITGNLSGTVGSVVTKTGYSLAATGLDLVLVDTKTLPAAMQIIAALCAGKVSGAGTGTEVFKGLDGTTTRVTVTVDGSGNRTTVVYA